MIPAPAALWGGVSGVPQVRGSAPRVLLPQCGVTMVAGAPGAGKSILARALAWGTGEPALLVVGDETMPRVADLTAAQVSYGDWDVDIVCPPRITPDGMSTWLDMSSIALGVRPRVVVVDSLYDCVTDGSYQDLMETIDGLTRWAAASRVALIVCHHTSEVESRSSPPRSRSRIKFGLAERPRLILTVSAEDSETGRVQLASVVKDRLGAADPSGQDAVVVYPDWQRGCLP